MKDYLVFINGMTPYLDEHNWEEEYTDLLDGVAKYHPEIKELLSDQIIFFQWGHPKEKGEHSPEAELARAQKHIKEMIYPPRSFKHKIADFFSTFLGYGRLAKVDNFLPGLGDVLWANTPHNISQIRHDFIDTMIQKGIKPDEIKSLHFISHSYGVTLGFDFIRDLFSSELSLADEKRNRGLLGDQLRYWSTLRSSVLSEDLSLGSFVGLASQLPMSITRSPNLLKTLSFGKSIPVNCFGISKDLDTPKIQFYYDKHDLLGFPTANIFETTKAIKDIEVNTGLLPISAHNDFWSTKKVHQSIGELLKENLSKSIKS
jgi:hypothetical protein